MRNSIPAVFAYTGCRLYQDILKHRFNDILNLKRPDEKSTLETHRALLFYEYVGNNLTTLDLIESILKTYQNVDFFLIIDDCYEGLIDENFLHGIKKMLNDNDNVTKIKILSSNKNIENKITEILDSNKMFRYFNIHLYMSEYDNIAPSEHTHVPNDQLREKKFLCVNRQERSHRIRTIDFLSKNDILNQTHASCLLGDYAPLLYDNVDFKMHNINVEKYQDPDLESVVLSNDSKQRLRKILPLELDIQNHQQKIFATNMPSLETYFNETYFSIITEGDFKNSTGKKQFTEKIVKCFAFHHPFLVLGLPGTLELLKDEGFITFSSFIDESYDQVTNDDKRMNMVFDQIKKLNNLNMHQMKNMYEDMMPILEHNYNHYLKKFAMNEPGDLVNEILDWYYL